MRLTFINVRAFANSKGWSVDRFSCGGFQVWKEGESRFTRPAFLTLSEVKAFVQAECGE